MADCFDSQKINDMKVTDLRKALKERGLPHTGNKPELVQRLQNYINAQSQSSDAAYSLDESTIPDGILDNSCADDTDDTPISIEKLPAKKLLQIKTPKTTNMSNGTKLVSTVSPTLSDAERAHKRAERFNMAASISDKKAQRAERFGLTNVINTSVSMATKSDDEKLKLRAQRFASNSLSTKQATHDTETDKIRKRAERFGLITGQSKTIPLNNPSTTEDEAKRRRLARFGAA